MGPRNRGAFLYYLSMISFHLMYLNENSRKSPLIGNSLCRINFYKHFEVEENLKITIYNKPKTATQTPSPYPAQIEQ